MKQSTKKRNENRQLANVHRKNDLLKATMSQRHEDYYGFVKTGFENGGLRVLSVEAFWRHLVDFNTMFDHIGF